MTKRVADSSGRRYLWLDMLRGLAVAEMIHGHSLDGLLDVGLRNTAFFVNWTTVRGYTAPVFLFAAGFAFAVATVPRLDSYTISSPKFIQRIRRLFFIILLGYLMYLPFFSLRQTILSIGTGAWDNFLKVDILRCIGVSALLLQCWLLLKPTKELSWVFIGLLTFALPVLTPYLRDNGYVLGLPAFLRYYIVGSRFPLFYYSSFLFLGFLLGHLFLEQRNRWFIHATIIALLFCLAAALLNRAGVLASLHHFLIKAGVIILLAVLLERCERVWIRMPSPVKYFGQESLVVYVVHLMVIYGSVLNKGLTAYWGKTLSYGEAYLFIIWLMAAMVVLAYTWHKLKVEHYLIAHWAKNIIYWSFLALFLLKPY
jgi:hypothetical protein